MSHRARGDRQAETCESARVVTRGDLEQLFTESLPALVYMLKLRRSAEALAGAEIEGPDRICAGALRNEALATFCSPPRQDLAAILGSHAGTEAVRALAAHLAWLISAFHLVVSALV
jgi:hypothetical protein